MPATRKNVKKKAPKKKIKAASCKCLEQVQEQLAKQGLRLKTEFAINFETGEISTIGPILEVEKLDPKSRKKVPAVFVTYCPFCGKKK